MMFSNSVRARSPLSGIRIQDAHGGIADRPRLEDGPALAQNHQHGFELGFGHREGRAFHRGDPLAPLGESEVRKRGDHHRRSAVDLPQQLVVDEHAAVFGGEQVGPAARRQANFERPAAHFRRHRHDGVVFADLALLELGHPDLAHTFGLEQLDVFLAEHVSLGQELLAPWTEDRAAEDSPGGFLDIDGLSFHLPPDPKLYKWLRKIQPINSLLGQMFFAGIPGTPLGRGQARDLQETSTGVSENGKRN